MTQQRLNISSGAKWESIVGYSRVVRVGNIIEVAGTTAVDEQGQVSPRTPPGIHEAVPHPGMGAVERPQHLAHGPPHGAHLAAAARQRSQDRGEADPDGGPRLGHGASACPGAAPGSSACDPVHAGQSARRGTATTRARAERAS